MEKEIGLEIVLSDKVDVRNYDEAVKLMEKVKGKTNYNEINLLFDLRNMEVYLPVQRMFVPNLDTTKEIDDALLKKLFEKQLLVILDFGEGPVLPILFKEGEAEKRVTMPEEVVGVKTNLMSVLQKASKKHKSLLSVMLDPLNCKMEINTELLVEIIKLYKGLGIIK